MADATAWHQAHNVPISTYLVPHFYEIGTNRPIFSDRDGVPKRELADIGYERRNGYAWYGNWPQQGQQWVEYERAGNQSPSQDRG